MGLPDAHTRQDSVTAEVPLVGKSFSTSPANSAWLLSQTCPPLSNSTATTPVPNAAFYYRDGCKWSSNSHPVSTLVTNWLVAGQTCVPLKKQTTNLSVHAPALKLYNGFPLTGDTQSIIIFRVSKTTWSLVPIFSLVNAATPFPPLSLSSSLTFFNSLEHVQLLLTAELLH